MKISMKILSSAALLAGSFTVLSATPPAVAQAEANAASVCLSPAEIKFTQAKDSRTILFTMRDGSMWLNTLAAPCPNLVSTGSAWTQTVHSDRICGNQQEITLIQTGNVCRLGTFTRVK